MWIYVDTSFKKFVEAVDVEKFAYIAGVHGCRYVSATNVGLCRPADTTIVCSVSRADYVHRVDFLGERVS